MHAVTRQDAPGGAGGPGPRSIPGPLHESGGLSLASATALSPPPAPALKASQAAGAPEAASGWAAILRWLAVHWPAWAMRVASIGCVVLAWQLATRYRLDCYVRFGNIPTPGDVWQRVLELNQSAKFMTNVGISVWRILLGFLVATGLGVTMGLLIGRYRWIRLAALPALEVLRPIPAIAWVPISIMLWPSNEVSIVFITFLGAFFPILLNTVHGVECVDDVLLRAARSLGARESTLLFEVVLPGALPQIFTGLSVGMGVAWVSLIAAEMISGQFGVGYATWEAYSLIDYPEIVLGMITIGVLGLLCSGTIRLFAGLCMPWMRSSSNGGH